MNQFRPQLVYWAVVLVVAFVASVLRHGFPPSEGWLSFLGGMIFFIGVQIPIWITAESSKDK